jgi:hypothetical protein
MGGLVITSPVGSTPLHVHQIHPLEDQTDAVPAFRSICISGFRYTHSFSKERDNQRWFRTHKNY